MTRLGLLGALSAAVLASSGVAAAQVVDPLVPGGGAVVEDGPIAPETPIGPPPQEEIDVFESIEGVSVTLRGLDKLTGEIDTIVAPVGESTLFWRMRVDVRVCYERTGGRSRESSAFLQIYDTKYEIVDASFTGWMFASSPALSAMDHPRYDFWVLSCNTS